VGVVNEADQHVQLLLSDFTERLGKSLHDVINDGRTNSIVRHVRCGIAIRPLMKRQLHRPISWHFGDEWHSMDHNRDRLMRHAVSSEPRQIFTELVDDVCQHADVLRQFGHGRLQTIGIRIGCGGRRRFWGLGHLRHNMPETFREVQTNQACITSCRADSVPAASVAKRRRTTRRMMSARSGSRPVDGGGRV
jgi:hypothetical protein